MDKEVFPKMNLFPTLEKIEHFAKEVFRLPRLFASHGDNFQHPLDDIYEQQNGWNSEGCYYEPSLDEKIYESYKDNF